MQYINLIDFKESNNFSNKDLAKLFGVSEIYISFLLNKKRTPSKKLAKKISEITGIPILNLLFPNGGES